MNYDIEKKTFSASAKDYFSALSQYPSFLKSIIPTKKTYAKLLEWFINNEQLLMSEDYSTPSIKDLAKQTGLEYSKMSSYLKSIYEDICEMNMQQPEKFSSAGTTMCNLSFEYIGCFATFYLGLHSIPRVNDVFHFSFISPLINGSHFYVRGITHHFENNRQNIHISVTGSELNPYLELLKAKAYFHESITWKEYYEPTNLTLKEKLYKMYRDL